MMLETKELVILLTFMLFFSAVAILVGLAEANPDAETVLVLALPEEYINYTITRVNGTLWAKIDGKYPLYFLGESGAEVSCVPDEIPMVYPTPPGTTNIHVWVNGTELAWGDWFYGTHHTAIGDWDMIFCVIRPASPFFVLTIHYEHPVEVVNGSNLLLYDLNIRDYLTEFSNVSTAHFSVRFEVEASDIRAYTTFTDSVWNPKYLEIKSDDDETTVDIEMRSVLGEPLAGDLVVIFKNSGQVEFPYWLVAVPVFVIMGFVMVLVYRRKRQ
jgi:hypothetical protein